MAKKFHGRISFRVVRELLSSICRHEQIRLRDYNTHNIVKYYTIGSNLEGKNVAYNTNNACSIWLPENYYTVFELSKNTNRNDTIGEFLILAYNHKEEFWILTEMFTDGKLYGFNPYLIFILKQTESIGRGIICKYGSDCEFKADNTMWNFDRLDIRKKAYLERKNSQTRLSNKNKLQEVFECLNDTTIVDPEFDNDDEST